MSRADRLLSHVVGPVVERIVIPPRPERCLPIPAPYSQGPTDEWVRQMTGGRAELWRHQALALRQIADGNNVVIATGTSSGKSLVFTTPLIHELLTGGGRAIVFYPQKALGTDQLRRFQTALEKAGLDPGLVGMINGDVSGFERDRVLKQCRIVLATPDAFHAWFMPQVHAPAAREFLSHLRFVVFDEAHMLEGVFGSNGAYFFRRVRNAHAELVGTHELQWIAATATIDKPAEHLEQLVGQPFAEITEDENGAPFHGLSLMHIAGPEHGIAAKKMLADLCASLANRIAPNAMIAFADSRQGVEHVAEHIGREDVVPYRGGYESSDRQAIEEKLRANELRGVISTSALELGIDIPQLEIGINLGVPQTLKSLKQRVGRIGRAMPGAFAVIAPATAFAQLGGTFREYFEGPVEPSRLYLDNRHIQIQAARCLIEESDRDHQTDGLADHVQWPAGFAAMIEAARPGAYRAGDLEQLMAIGSDSPHRAFPLRRMRETEYVLRDVRNPSEQLGKIDLERALREAYPGGTYYHNRRKYRVIEWRSSTYEHSIVVQPAKGAPITHPLITTAVSVSTQRGELIDDHLLAGERGQMAESLIKVADSVVGYRCGSATHLYRDLRTNDKRLSRRIREFATTGVLLQIKDPWFAGKSEHAQGTRKAIAEALAAVLSREHGIAPSDIRTAHWGIALHTPAGPRVVDDAIVVFDNMIGGLRLTSPLFSNFGGLLDRLARASTLAGADAILGETTISRLRDFHESLSQRHGVDPAPRSDPVDAPPAGGAASELLIYAPGSIVGARFHGTIQERKIIAPKFLSTGDSDILGYRYECEGGSGWVPHETVEPIGHDWRHVLWSPSSGEMHEVAA